MADVIADQKIREHEASAPKPAASNADDIVSHMERIVQLEQACSLTAEQANALKDKLITS